MRVEWNPLDAPWIEDPAEAATWSAIRMLARSESGRDHIFCEHFDREAKTVADTIFDSVLPLAEWLARSWLHIFTACRVRPHEPSTAGALYAWDRTHCLRFVGGGALFPNATLSIGSRGLLRLTWREDSPEDAQFQPIVYQTRERLDLDIERCRLELEGFVDSVLARLRERAPNSQRMVALDRKWRAVRVGTDPEHVAEVVAASLGVLREDATPEEVAAVATVTRHATNELLLAVLDALRLDQVPAVVRLAERRWEGLATAPAPSRTWLATRSALRRKWPAEGMTQSHHPWERGWSAAAVFRSHRGVAHDEPLQGVGRHFPAPSRTRNGLPAGIDGYVAWRAGHRPQVVRRSLESPTRDAFSAARALYAYYFAGSPDSDQVSVYSNRVTGRHAVANAFAAELLAPIQWLRRRVRRAVIDLEDVHDLAGELRAPFLCVLHQLENHGLARVPLR